MPHSHPGKYPRLPIRGALERYCSSKLHMRPALRCTRRRGVRQGGPPVTTGDLDEWAPQRTCVLGTWVFVCLL